MKPQNRFHCSPREIAFGALALVALGLLAGCVLTSVYPYYTARDVVFDSALVGRWGEADKPDATNEFWEFTGAATNAGYTLTVHEGAKPKTYQAHLFRLKQWTFLDVLPTEEHDDYVPPHYLLKVTQIKPTLKVALMDYKWAGEFLEKHPGALRHIVVGRKPGEMSGGQLVLTAETAELQAFLLKHVSDTNAFPGSLDLLRLP